MSTATVLVRRRSLRLLGSLLHPLRLRLVLTAIVVVVSTAGQVAGPAIIAFGIDNGITALHSQNWLPVAAAGVAYLFTGIIGAVLISWYTVLSARISQAILIDLRKRVFLHTQKLSLEFHESYTSGRIISRQTSDLDSIRELLDSGINQLVQGFLYMLFIAIALFWLDWLSGVVLLCSLVPLYLLTRWFQKRSQALFRVSRVASAKLIVHFVETMTGIRAVKAFRKEKRNEKEFGGLVEDYRDVNARVIQLFGIFDPGLVMIGNVTVGVVLLVGGFRVANGQLAIGVLLAALLYTRRFFDPMEEMAMFYNSYQPGQACRPLDGRRPRALRRRDIRLQARSRHPAGVQSGHPGGADDRVGRFHRCGQIHAGQADLAVLRPERRLRHARRRGSARHAPEGPAPGDRHGHPGGVPVQRVGRRQHRDEVVEAAKAVGAHEFITGLPNGYDTDVNKRGGRVSAGQRQLISFARAFLANPAVLILDEATSSLDIPSERLVQEALQTLLADRTAVIIAHRLSTVAIADRVLVMEHGKVVEDGSPDQLIAGTGRFAQLHAAWRDSLV